MEKGMKRKMEGRRGQANGKGNKRKIERNRRTGKWRKNKKEYLGNWKKI